MTMKEWHSQEESEKCNHFCFGQWPLKNPVRFRMISKLLVCFCKERIAHWNIWGKWSQRYQWNK